MQTNISLSDMKYSTMNEGDILQEIPEDIAPREEEENEKDATLKFDLT